MTAANQAYEMLSRLERDLGLSHVLVLLAQIAWERHAEQVEEEGMDREGAVNWGAVSGALWIQASRPLILRVTPLHLYPQASWFTRDPQLPVDQLILSTQGRAPRPRRPRKPRISA